MAKQTPSQSQNLAQKAAEAQQSQEQSFFRYVTGLNYTVIEIEDIKGDTRNKTYKTYVYNPATDAGQMRDIKSNSFNPMMFRAGFNTWFDDRVSVEIKQGNARRPLRLNDPFFLSPDGFEVEYEAVPAGTLETISGKGMESQPMANGVADPSYRQIGGKLWYKVVPVTERPVIVIPEGARPYGENLPILD
jgi:hypothetical protein